MLTHLPPSKRHRSAAPPPLTGALSILASRGSDILVHHILHLLLPQPPDLPLDVGAVRCLCRYGEHLVRSRDNMPNVDHLMKYFDADSVSSASSASSSASSASSSASSASSSGSSASSSGSSASYSASAFDGLQSYVRRTRLHRHGPRRLVGPMPLLGHEGFINALAVCGDRIMSGSSDRTIRVWNVETGQCEGTMQGGHTSSVRALAVLPCHLLPTSSASSTSSTEPTSLVASRGARLLPRLLSGASDGTVMVWNGRDSGGGRAGGNGEDEDDDPCLATCTTHCAPWRRERSLDDEDARAEGSDGGDGWGGVYALAVHAATNTILVGMGNGTIRVWDMESWTLARSLEATRVGYTDAVRAIVVVPREANTVVSAGCAGSSRESRGFIRIWNTVSWTCEHVFGHEHTSTVTSLVMCSDGRLLSGSNDGTIAVWVVGAAGAVGGGGRELTEAAATEAATTEAATEASASSSSSSYATRHEATLEGHSGAVLSLATCGTTILSGASDKTLRVWSSANDGVGDAAGGGGGEGGEDLGSSSSSSSPSSSSPLQWRCVRTLDNPGRWANDIVVYHGRVLSGSSDRSIRMWT